MFCDKIRDEITSESPEQYARWNKSPQRSAERLEAKKCKRREFKNGFLIVVGLLVEFLLYFLLTNKWLLLAVIIALDIFLLVVIRLLIRDVEITNVEKIQEQVPLLNNRWIML